MVYLCLPEVLTNSDESITDALAQSPGRLTLGSYEHLVIVHGGHF